MWPVATFNNRFGRAGHLVNRLLMIPDYRQSLQLGNDCYKDWAKLDLFDMLSPAFDNPATVRKFTRWFEELDLERFEVRPGYNGLEARATK
jgi:hypothetical protein